MLSFLYLISNCCIAGRDDFGSARPLCMAISSDGKAATITKILLESTRLITECGHQRGTLPLDSSFAPQSVSIDKDFESLKAIRVVWPHAMVIWCLFHLLRVCPLQIHMFIACSLRVHHTITTRSPHVHHVHYTSTNVHRSSTHLLFEVESPRHDQAKHFRSP
jgi:hypothetical protein